jgi:hypothetical protein
MQLLNPYRHFSVLVFLILFFTAMVPAWSKGHLLLTDLLYIVPMVIVALCALPLFKWWEGTKLYWSLQLEMWAYIAGKLVSLIVLVGLIYGAWWVSGLVWFHLAARDHFIFLLAMVAGGAIWLTVTLIDFVSTMLDIRRIMRLPDELAERRSRHE